MFKSWDEASEIFRHSVKVLVLARRQDRGLYTYKIFTFVMEIFYLGINLT